MIARSVFHLDHYSIQTSVFLLSAHVGAYACALCVLFRRFALGLHDTDSKRLSTLSAARTTTHSNHCAKYLEMPIFPILNSIHFHYMSLTRSQSIKDMYSLLPSYSYVCCSSRSPSCVYCLLFTVRVEHIDVCMEYICARHSDSFQTMLIESRWLKNKIQCEIHRCLIFKLSIGKMI